MNERIMDDAFVNSDTGLQRYDNFGPVQRRFHCYVSAG